MRGRMGTQVIIDVSAFYFRIKNAGCWAGLWSMFWQVEFRLGPGRGSGRA
jgi:hypothetical protein